jgi:vitamin B12 transporter
MWRGDFMMTISRAASSLFLTAVSFTAFNASTAFADETSPEQNNELDPIVVTATLGPRTVGESLSSVTVIDQETIRKQNPRDINDLIIGQPGVDITTNGSYGKTASVFTRGFGSESTVLLVDGIRIRSATTGGAPWQFVSPQLLQRIEIVRGPRSGLYGADAGGGVIQGFTQSAGEEPRGWVSAGAGNFDTQQLGAGVSGREGRNGYSFAINNFKTDGTEVFEGGEDKGYRNTSGVASLSHELDNGGKASVLAMRAEGNTEFEGGETDFAIQALGAKIDLVASDYLRSSIQFSESRDQADTVRSSGPSTFNTRTRSARWENTVVAGVHEFVLGLEHTTDEVSGTTDYEESSRSNDAMFGQAAFNFGPTDILLSLRRDDNEAYGAETTGGLALGYAIDRNHRLRTSYSTAFKAPSFNDLYFPNFGDPDQKPEQAESVEVGMSGRYQTWFWDVAVYQSDVEDLSLTDGQTAGSVPEARIRGIELGSGLEMGEWRLGAAVTLMDARNPANDKRLRRRTHQTARLDVDRSLGAWFLGATVAAQGYRYNDEENEVRLPGFATVNLRAGWEFAQDWTASLSVNNILDKQYVTTRQSFGAREDYLAAGTSSLLSVRYDFR